MYDSNAQYIIYGIEYNEEKFMRVKNYKFMSDANLPPTKPIGGIWASTYIPNKDYMSEWHKFIMQKLSPELFRDKINAKSTIIKLAQNARVYKIDSWEEIKIGFEDGFKEADEYLSTHHVKAINGIDKGMEKVSFIDFENTAKRFDAIYISSKAVNNINDFISWYEAEVARRNGVLTEEEERRLAETICKAYLFEDWHIESLLILNKDIIEVIKYIDNNELS